jgi:hypothetical protein
LRDRRKHLVDSFTVLLPKRRVATPSVKHRVVGLHQRKYNYRAHPQTTLFAVEPEAASRC